ncbi:MAG: hypothetical protein AB8C84_07150 [Oligoflexales bacterium]
MGIRSLQKKFKRYFLFCILFSFQATANDVQKLPVVRNVAVIPPQFFSSQDGDRFPHKESVEDIFRSEVRGSGKYTVLSQEIAEDLWDTYKERQFVKKHYDLDAWFSLLVAKDTDRVVLTVRMLDSDFTLWSQDSLTLEKLIWNKAKDEERKHWVRTILYGLMNKWPIDAYVTSIHEPFITLSGGHHQGLRIGDRLKLNRVVVSENHPATGAFYKYDQDFLGYAKIVDLQKTTSVAKISDLVSYQPLSVGDGVKVEHSKLRTYFQYFSTKSVDIPTSSLVAVRLNDESQKLLADSSAVFQKNIKSFAKNEEEDYQKNKSANDQSVDLDEENDKEDDKNGFVDLFSFDGSMTSPSDDSSGDGPSNGYMSYFADNMTLHAGYHHWKYHGPVGASGQFVSPINEIGVSVTRGVLPLVKYTFDVTGGFSKTKASGPVNATHLSALARIFWNQKVKNSLWFDKWFAGAVGGFQSLSVKNDGYGGYDNLVGGFYGGVQGAIEENGRDVANWTLESSLTPLHIGRVGYDNKLHSIQSALDLEVGFHVSWFNRRPKTIDWGLGLIYGQTQFVSPGTTNDTSTQSRLNRLVLSLSARWDYAVN